MGINRLLGRYPILFFVVAGIIIANNFLNFAPAQVLRGNIRFIVPGILIAFGTIGYVMKMKEKKKEV